MKRSPRLRSWLVRISLSLLALLLLLSVGVWIFAPSILQKVVEGEGFRAMLSREVSKSMKVDGEFAPLKLEGWTAVTESYSSTGWPGEAIGGLDAKGIRGTFNPGGVLKRLWLVDLILIDQGKFSLRNPDDALKRQPVKGKRPWYAALMPQQFHCDWIDCTTADVEFPLGTNLGALRDVHLGATMIGQDFKYWVNGGRFEFPDLPPLAIDSVEIYVTREMVDVGYAFMRDPSGGPAQLELSGRMGQREDKSIRAKASFTALPIAPAMPESLRKSITGLASGDLSYDSDTTGKNASGGGKLSLSGASLSQWGALDELARVHKNPELSSFVFEDFQLDYRLEKDVFSVSELVLSVKDKIRLAGSLAYDIQNDTGKIDVALSEMPLSAWLPSGLKSLTNASITGQLNWDGPIKDYRKSKASGFVDFGKSRLENPVPSLDSLGEHAVRFPQEITLDVARVDFQYLNGDFQATHLNLHAPGFFHVSGSGQWTVEDRLMTDLNFSFLDLSAWLPTSLKNKVSGDLSGSLNWNCPGTDISHGAGSGTLWLSSSQLDMFQFQQFLARFLKDDTWLKIKLSKASLSWSKSEAGISVEEVDIFAKGQIGLRGKVKINADGSVNGVLLAGVTAGALDWLPNATETVFSKSDDGLHWAEIRLSGTVHKLENDLTKQILGQLEKHPFALAKLATRGLSWWAGDIFGTAPEFGNQKKSTPGKPEQPAHHRPPAGRPRR